MSLASFLSQHTVIVKRQTETVGASGGRVLTDSTRYVNQPCLVRELPSNELARVLSQEGFQYTHEVSFVGESDPKADTRDYFVFTDSQGRTRNLLVQGRFNPFQQNRYVTYQCQTTDIIDGN